MIPPKVFYIQKLDNPPLYNAGKELCTVEYDRGWVEYLNETSDIYYSPGLSQFHYQSILPSAVRYIKDFYQTQSTSNLGLLYRLLAERLEHPFAIPIIIYSDFNLFNITCGTVRFTALVLCGVDPASIPAIFQVEKNQTITDLNQTHLISSTAHINQVAELENKELIISFSSTPIPRILNTTLRNTMYDSANANTFDMDGNGIINFWKQFTTDNRINIVVSSDASIRKLIKFSENIWNVKFQPLEPDAHSLAKMFEKFNDPENKQLNLYVSDITEEFNLEYLIPWTTPKSVWYHTLNKKIHLFSTLKGPNSAQWPIVAMGNFVK